MLAINFFVALKRILEKRILFLSLFFFRFSLSLEALLRILEPAKATEKPECRQFSRRALARLSPLPRPRRGARVLQLPLLPRLESSERRRLRKSCLVRVLVFFSPIRSAALVLLSLRLLPPPTLRRRGSLS